MTTRGGVRPGAGRKPGSNDYGESTRAIRVPLSLYPDLQDLLARIKTQRKSPGRPAGTWALDTASGPLSLPLFASRVPAGFPSPADDYIDQRLDLNDHLINHPAATFFVRVSGDSMFGASLHDGDLLIEENGVRHDYPASLVCRCLLMRRVVDRASSPYEA